MMTGSVISSRKSWNLSKKAVALFGSGFIIFCMFPYVSYFGRIRNVDLIYFVMTSQEDSRLGKEAQKIKDDLKKEYVF